MKHRFRILILATVNLPWLFSVALISRWKKDFKQSDEYIVYWGTEPIINNFYWAEATKEIFTRSHFVTRYDSSILNNRAHKVLFNERKLGLKRWRYFHVIKENLTFVSFLTKVLCTANLVCISCEGFVFQHYKVSGFNYRVEAFLLKIAKIRICVLPYGGDSHVYSRLHDMNWLYGLLSDYPQAAREQRRIAERLDFYIEKSDMFLPGPTIFDGMGRSDWITPSTLCISAPNIQLRARGQSTKLIITHSPNHRVVKGTAFVIQSIEILMNEGLPVELRLLENKPNSEVLKTLAEESDLHIDQLFFDGYGLSALEAMALGIPTIGNFSGQVREFFNRWSFASECPMIIANEETLVGVIRELALNRELLKEISEDSMKYVEKYHSYEAFAEAFSNVVKKHDLRYEKILENRTPN